MAKAFYLKELVNQKLYLPNGAPVPFEDVGGSYGLLATEDPYIQAELAKAIKARTGGVIQLAEEDYNVWVEKKRTSPSSSQSPRDREALQPIPFQQLQALRAAGAAAVLASPPLPPTQPNVVSSPNQSQQQAGQQRVHPISVPTSFSKPKVGKVSKSGAPSPVAPLNAPPPASHVEGT